MKHKHCELIKAWADGAEIQYKDGRAWWDITDIDWNDDDMEYRIKPEEKNPVVRWMWSDEFGYVSCDLMTNEEAASTSFSIKLEWSRTEFPE